MNHLSMYILSGMSFAGKSVLAREISRAKHVEIIDPDEVAHERRLGLHGEFLSDAVWCDILKQLYDTTAFNKEQRDHLREIARACGATPIVIIVSIEREEAFKRWQENTLSRQRALVHIEDFQMCADAFTFPGEDEEYLVYHADEESSLWIKNNLW
jgi:hypothetical protein